MLTFTTTALGLVAKMTKCKVPMSEELVVQILANGLPRDYDLLVTDIRSNAYALRQFFVMVSEKAKFFMQRSSAASVDQSVANLTLTSNKLGPCAHCHKSGHLKKDCYTLHGRPDKKSKPKDQPSKPDGPCSHCGGKNHTESVCYKKHGYPDKKGKGKPIDQAHAAVTVPSTGMQVFAFTTKSGEISRGEEK